MPVYAQIAERIKIDIFSNKMQPGSKLPSVRDFALELQVNPNTVQRALNELEDEGLIITERTNGKYVTNNQILIRHHRRKYADELTRIYRHKMRKIGF